MHPRLFSAWSAIGSDTLRQVLRQIDHAPPADFTPWLLGSRRIGWLAPQHLEPLCRWLPRCGHQAQSVIWEADDLDSPTRSSLLAQAAAHLRDEGWVRGWRNELYSYLGEIEDAPGPHQAEWFRMERAAFRFLGLRSHAVHINGFRSDGHIWCGIRALSKATDPGRIDNLAAGGLPADESLRDCAIRELYEEAGLPADIARQIRPAGRVLTRRHEPEGWHDEALLVYNLMLPDEIAPRNLDGEVSGFICLSPAEAMARLPEMTEDAAGVLAQGLLALRAASPAPP
jgi:8-oxo-dGTP pyrophosphatase MutT (NUDIX family)